ncbi:hypothetical protein BU16DRAFT_567398 [Lophium mytilinum]|uniref:Anaphase-promoting complex subunit 11 n=1 Tax=Lophium mytilinum TaxID=390894 RepID=A0A6A6Q9W7_9PEZI|nr:hypothetical protein BU16DRAFT_567398 [Lophium mytilinum]
MADTTVTAPAEAPKSGVRACSEDLGPTCSLCKRTGAQAAKDAGGAVLTILCKHIYHLDCLKKWLATDKNCPLCTTILTLEEPTAPESSDTPIEFFDNGVIRVKAGLGEWCRLCERWGPTIRKPGDESAVRILKCQHVFHEACLRFWVVCAKNQCPTCETSIFNQKAEDWVGRGVSQDDFDSFCEPFM